MFRAIAKIQLGDYEGAEIDGTEAISRNPFLPQAFYARGFTRMKQGKYKEAAQDFTKALEFSPGSPHLLISRMDANEKYGNYEGAMEDIEAFMKMNPKNTGLWYEKGRIYLSLKDTVAAEQAFNRLIKADSTSFIGWSARGLLKLQRKDLNGAYEDYSEAIKQNSTYFGDYMNRGIINVDRKRYMEALADYDQAIKLEPNNKMIYFNRGLLRSNLGDNNNALADFEQVLKMDSSNMEARYSKALLEMKLRNYRNAIADYKIILEKHPYFLPVYWGLAEAYDAMNNVKEAFKFREKARDLEKNKDKLRDKIKEDPNTGNMVAEEIPKHNVKRRTDIFNRYATTHDNDYESKFTNEKRGAVQHRFVDLINEKNFVLTYYSKTDALRQTNLFSPEIEAYNRKKRLSADIKITCSEIALTNELIDKHFTTINEITSKINAHVNDADIYFHRALEFALVQDFENAIEDLNKAIALRSDFMLAYFTRANIRYKYIDYMKNSLRETGLETIELKDKYAAFEKEKKFDVELVMRDLDKVSELQPDFSFAYYNKANILTAQKDFRTAIYNYTKAIESDKDFAEAYFNRGLAYLFIGEDGKGLSDLSKAGELGIYQAYNLIQRFKMP